MLSLPDFREKTVLISFAREGQKVSFKNDNILITDKEGNVLVQNSCHRLFSLWIVGNTTLTSGILQRSKRFGFSIFLMNQSHRLYGYWASATEGNFLLRKKQYSYYGVDIACHLVQNKIANQLNLLRTIRRKTGSLKTTIQNISELNGEALKCVDFQSLLGLEGNVSRMYFKGWFGELGWKGRKPRAKRDFINSVLDIGYTFLFNFVDCMLNLYGFDLYEGVYHRNFYQRKSLVCDLVEPFRCIIDHQVKKAFNLKELCPEHFDVYRGQYRLKFAHNKAYTKWLLTAILTHKEEIFSYFQSYYRSFIREKPLSEYPVFNFKPQ